MMIERLSCDRVQMRFGKVMEGEDERKFLCIKFLEIDQEGQGLAVNH